MKESSLAFQNKQLKASSSYIVITPIKKESSAKPLDYLKDLVVWLQAAWGIIWPGIWIELWSDRHGMWIYLDDKHGSEKLQ